VPGKKGGELSGKTKRGEKGITTSTNWGGKSVLYAIRARGGIISPLHEGKRVFFGCRAEERGEKRKRKKEKKGKREFGRGAKEGKTRVCQGEKPGALQRIRACEEGEALGRKRGEYFNNKEGREEGKPSDHLKKERLTRKEQEKKCPSAEKKRKKKKEKKKNSAGMYQRKKAQITMTRKRTDRQPVVRKMRT